MKLHLLSALKILGLIGATASLGQDQAQDENHNWNQFQDPKNDKRNPKQTFGRNLDDPAAPVKSPDVAFLATQVCGAIHPIHQRCGSNVHVVHVVYGLNDTRWDGCASIGLGCMMPEYPFHWFCEKCKTSFGRTSCFPDPGPPVKRKRL